LCYNFVAVQFGFEPCFYTSQVISLKDCPQGDL